MDEKRKEPRVEVNWPIKAFIDNRIIEGKTKDISLNGICIQFENPINLKGEISISIFPPSCSPINVIGKIVWSSTSTSTNDKPIETGMLSLSISKA